MTPAWPTTFRAWRSCAHSGRCRAACSGVSTRCLSGAQSGRRFAGCIRTSPPSCASRAVVACSSITAFGSMMGHPQYRSHSPPPVKPSQTCGNGRQEVGLFVRQRVLPPLHVVENDVEGLPRLPRVLRPEARLPAYEESQQR